MTHISELTKPWYNILTMVIVHKKSKKRGGVLPYRDHPEFTAINKHDDTSLNENPKLHFHHANILAWSPLYTTCLESCFRILIKAEKRNVNQLFKM